jgi:sulfur-carrier protein adenylyltransferase/sulfurtransferase
MNRFESHIKLKGFGEDAQQKLGASSVLVVGAGGLGCPAIQYLASSGMGKLGIADGDLVEASNLNRQVLYAMRDVGRNKANCVAEYLAERYPDTTVDGYPFFIHTNNACDILSRYDVILDCSDNVPTRYLLNDCCMLLNKPLVHASVYENQAQLSVFAYPDEQGNCYSYRDLYPNFQLALKTPDCNDTGVLAVLTGLMGIHQAAECIKIISGTGSVLAGSMLHYHLNDNSTHQFGLSIHPEGRKHQPQSIKEFRHFNYHQHKENPLQLSWPDALRMQEQQTESLLWIDVRNEEEHPRLALSPLLNIPLYQIEEKLLLPENIQTLLLFCSNEARSLQACAILRNKYSHLNIYAIKGGARAYPSMHNTEEHGA